MEEDVPGYHERYMEFPRSRIVKEALRPNDELRKCDKKEMHLSGRICEARASTPPLPKDHNEESVVVERTQCRFAASETTGKRGPALFPSSSHIKLTSFGDTPSTADKREAKKLTEPAETNLFLESACFRRRKMIRLTQRCDRTASGDVGVSPISLDLLPYTLWTLVDVERITVHVDALCFADGWDGMGWDGMEADASVSFPSKFRDSLCWSRPLFPSNRFDRTKSNRSDDL
ncbi:unnamed protein product, partial [Musa acuminata subsp. burmannicoides]